MNRLNKQAFTLIEMLVVVIIIGVVLAIAIPAVSNLINNNENRMYNTHLEIIDQKTKLFIDQHKGELQNISATCFQVNYRTLVEQEFIVESDVHCTGTIIINKSGNNKNFSSKYYLSCTDKKGNSLNDVDSVPTGCTLFTGN